ncbi:MAG TPA: sulfatase-like hydrolase/transferase [Solirubrobacterales bacterium]|nr:sulfatase-like hydrolase/transferase [Solirubrobacterales bacterium]
MLAAGPLAGSSAAAPNVVVFVTDDQRLAGTMAVMPKTRQWFQTGGSDAAGPFRGGTYFPNAVANTPWCCPARASILTGQYSHNHGVTRLDGELLGTTPAAPKQQQTMMAYLKAANPSYRTAIFGKYLNGWGIQCSARPPGDPADPPPFFDEYSIFNAAYSPTCVNENGTEKQVWRHSTRYVTEKAVDFLDRVGNQPWFLYVAPYTPHVPFVPEANYLDTPVPALDETGAVFERNRTDKPPWLQNGELEFDADWTRENWQAHLRMLMSADDMVDTVMRKIRAIGQDQDTIAFFTSDNGYMWGDHGASAKARPYMSSIEVPFFMRWPGWAGHPGNETDNRLVGHVDIAPTVLGLAGITPAAGDLKDGRTLLDVTNPRRRILTELAGGDSLAGRWSAIHTSDVHYIETYGINPDDSTNYSDVFREYYDLTRDAAELRNLLGDGDPRNDPPFGALAAAVANDRACAGATCPRGGERVPLEARITRGAAEDVFSDDSSANDPATSGFLDGEFHFTSNEPRSRFECRLEALNGQYGGRDWHECWSPTTYSPLVNGPYRFSVRAVDAADAARTSPVQTYQWTVASTTRPETRIVLTPPKRANSQIAWFSFSGSKPASSFKCKLDASPLYSPCATVASFAVQDTAADAPHELSVVAVGGGGEDPTPAVYRWSVDSTPLTVQGLTADAPSHEREATFNFGFARSAAAGEANDLPSRFECKLDAEEYEPCGMPLPAATWTKPYRGLAKGSHTFRVRVVDRIGNVSAPVTHQWTVGDAQTFKAAPDTRWPDVVGTHVESVISDGCGGWYVGGSFTGIGSVGGFTNLGRIAASKTVDAIWKPNVAGGRIRSMILSSDKRTLYIGGDFTSVNGVPRRHLAALTTPLATACGSAAGNAVTGWNPDPNNAVHALAFAGAKHGGESYVYAAGAFSNFHGATVTRRKLAQLRTTDNGTVVAGWDPGVNNTATLYAVEVFMDSVYTGGAGLTTIGGAARRNLAEIDAATARATSWNPSPNDTVQAIEHRRRAVFDDVATAMQLPTVLVGGSFTQIGNPPKSRPGAAELGASDDGGATPWSPGIDASHATYDFLPITTDETIIGGSFGTRLAETDRFTGALLGWSPGPDRGALDLAFADPVLAVGGVFDSVNPGTPVPRRLLAFYCRTDAPTATGPCS